MRTFRLLAAAAAVALPLTAAAAPVSATPHRLTPPFTTSVDKPGDLMSLDGTPADAESSGLDVLSVRQRVRRDGKLVIVTKHRDLTRANANTDPDAVPVGGSVTVFAAYIDPTPTNPNDAAYGLSFDRNRKLVITETLHPGTAVPCPYAARWSRIDLMHNAVRYVVPLSCISEVRSTRTVAQVIRYKVIGRAADGVEQLTLAALDQNNTPIPATALH